MVEPVPTSTTDIGTRTDANAQPLGRARGERRARSAARPIDLSERTLPHSLEAEMAVLGAVLLEPREAGSQVFEHLSEESFYAAKHQVIFREMAALQDAMQTVDVTALTQRLRDKNLLEEVGGPVYLAELVERVPTAANVEHYIRIVSEKHLLRRLISASLDILGRAYDRQDEVGEWLDEVEQQIFSITAEKTLGGPLPVRHFIKDAMVTIERLYDQRGAISGISTGFRDLDRMTSGLHDGNMVVIAARPGMGKTSLAMNIVEHVALDQQLPVAVFSLEMSAQELVMRLLCSRTKVNLRNVREGYMSERDFGPLTTVASQLMKAPLYIDDTPGLTISQVRSRARRLKSQFGIRLLVIDYLQLMRSPSKRAELNRQVEIADISMGIKALAKELSIPIIVLSQLNRSPEQRTDGKPKLGDLRESGAIEQDADVVMMLVRPEVYAETPEDKEAERGKATLIIAKQRNGPTGEIELVFQHEYTRFLNAAKVDSDDVAGFAPMPGGEE